jgi:hypothetical protein
MAELSLARRPSLSGHTNQTRLKTVQFFQEQGTFPCIPNGSSASVYTENELLQSLELYSYSLLSLESRSE